MMTQTLIFYQPVRENQRRRVPLTDTKSITNRKVSIFENPDRKTLREKITS